MCSSTTFVSSNHTIAVARYVLLVRLPPFFRKWSTSYFSTRVCSWHPKLSPHSYCLGVTASPYLLHCLEVRVIMVVRPYGWITAPPSIPVGGMVYCSTVGGVTNYLVSLSSNISNCLTGGISNCGGGGDCIKANMSVWCFQEVWALVQLG